ncbi:MAG TPA: Ig-like domain-containing protein [Solirubrobacteraceae bacterium]
MTRWALAALACLLIAVASVHRSRATFTASTSNAASFATSADWVAPVVTLASPADGALTNSATPTLSGTAGTATGDGTTVTVRVYAGASATGSPLQTLTPTRTGGSWSTTAATLTSGTFTAQASQSDSSGNTGTSAAHTFTVDTIAPTATAVAAANGGATAGTVDAGDVITFSYSEPIDPASVLAGWSGASTAVQVRVTAGVLAPDPFTVLDGSGGTTVHLGTVQTNGDYVTTTATFAATMVRSADHASVVVTLGALQSGLVSVVPVAAQNMTWTVDAAVKDLAGNAVTTTSVTESASDVDF